MFRNTVGTIRSLYNYLILLVLRGEISSYFGHQFLEHVSVLKQVQ